MISMENYLVAVDTVCMNCAFGEETCEVCPVRKTVDKMTANETVEETLKPELHKYHVVIHYEGGYSYEVEAETEDKAREIAENLFMDAEPLEVWNNVDWKVCDSWELK